MAAVRSMMKIQPGFFSLMYSKETGCPCPSLRKDSSTGGKADVAVYPTCQPRLRAEGGHLVACNRQHQPASFAFGGFALLGEQRVNLRIQFRHARFLTENPRQGLHLLLAAGADIAVVHRQIYGGRVFRQLFIRFRTRPPVMTNCGLWRCRDSQSGSNSVPTVAALSNAGCK